MKNYRNILLFGALGFFFAWYGLSWAYESLYREPRQRLGNELTKLKTEIENGKKNALMMNQFTIQNQGFYYRSLPLIPDTARTQYSFWLLELLKYCGIEKPDVDSSNPTRTAFGLNYRVSIKAECSLVQLTQFLFEFYYAPFLQRITSLTISPLEEKNTDTPDENKKDKISVVMTIDILALRPSSPQAPVPWKDKLPTGYIPRLKSNDVMQYQVVADRNLLQAVKGGADKADYAFLTSINTINEEQEIWISIRTDNTIVKVNRGETVKIGSFIAKVVAINEQDVVFEKGGLRWLVSIGDCLNQAFAIPPEFY
jgi:hypothetical protein